MTEANDDSLATPIQGSSGENEKVIRFGRWPTQVILTFFNSGLGLLLVGAAVGALGLFTWQRQDWVFKQAYLREEVMLDRRLDMIETINTEMGAFVADASSVIVAVQKQVSRDQLNELVRTYNEEQAKWFGSAPAQSALLEFYFSPSVSKEFNDKLLKVTESVDVAVYQAEGGSLSWQDAWETREAARRDLQLWNALAFAEMQSK